MARGSRRLRELRQNGDGKAHAKSQTGFGEHVPQNDFNMRAALSHSRSRVAGQNASLWTRALLAAATLILARPLTLLLLDRLAHQEREAAGLLLLPLELWMLALDPEFLFSQAGRKLETRCMLARRRRASPSLPGPPGTTERAVVSTSRQSCAGLAGEDAGCSCRGAPREQEALLSVAAGKRRRWEEARRWRRIVVMMAWRGRGGGLAKRKGPNEDRGLAVPLLPRRTHGQKQFRNDNRGLGKKICRRQSRET